MAKLPGEGGVPGKLPAERFGHGQALPVPAHRRRGGARVPVQAGQGFQRVDREPPVLPGGVPALQLQRQLLFCLEPAPGPGRVLAPLVQDAQLLPAQGQGEAVLRVLPGLPQSGKGGVGGLLPGDGLSGLLPVPVCIGQGAAHPAPGTPVLRLAGEGGRLFQGMGLFLPQGERRPGPVGQLPAGVGQFAPGRGLVGALRQGPQLLHPLGLELLPGRVIRGAQAAQPVQQAVFQLRVLRGGPGDLLKLVQALLQQVPGLCGLALLLQLVGQPQQRVNQQPPEGILAGLPQQPFLRQVPGLLQPMARPLGVPLCLAQVGQPDADDPQPGLLLRAVLLIQQGLPVFQHPPVQLHGLVRPLFIPQKVGQVQPGGLPVALIPDVAALPADLFPQRQRLFQPGAGVGVLLVPAGQAQQAQGLGQLPPGLSVAPVGHRLPGKAAFFQPAVGGGGVALLPADLGQPPVAAQPVVRGLFQPLPVHTLQQFQGIFQPVAALVGGGLVGAGQTQVHQQPGLGGQRFIRGQLPPEGHGILQRQGGVVPPARGPVQLGQGTGRPEYIPQVPVLVLLLLPVPVQRDVFFQQRQPVLRLAPQLLLSGQGEQGPGQLRPGRRGGGQLTQQPGGLFQQLRPVGGRVPAQHGGQPGGQQVPGQLLPVGLGAGVPGKLAAQRYQPHAHRLPQLGLFGGQQQQPGPGVGQRPRPVGEVLRQAGALVPGPADQRQGLLPVGLLLGAEPQRPAVQPPGGGGGGVPQQALGTGQGLFQGQAGVLRVLFPAAGVGQQQPAFAGFLPQGRVAAGAHRPFQQPHRGAESLRRGLALVPQQIAPLLVNYGQRPQGLGVLLVPHPDLGGQAGLFQPAGGLRPVLLPPGQHRQAVAGGRGHVPHLPVAGAPRLLAEGQQPLPDLPGRGGRTLGLQLVPQGLEGVGGRLKGGGAAPVLPPQGQPPVGQPLLPGAGLFHTALHTLAGAVHGGQLFHGLGPARLGGGLDQPGAPGRVALGADAAQVGQTDQVFVLRVAPAAAQPPPGQDPFQPGGQRPGGLVVDAGGQVGIGPGQPDRVGRFHPHRQHRFPRPAGGGVFLLHHIVGAHQQVGGHGEHKHVAGFQRLLDGAVKGTARHQELVVPDRQVPELLVFVDAPHELLGQIPVVLAVAQEQPGVKGGLHPGGQLAADQHPVQKGPQLVGVGQGGGVVLPGVQTLQVAKGPVEALLQAGLRQDGQHRDMAFQRQGQLSVPGAAGLLQQPVGHRQHEQLHLGQVLAAQQPDGGLFRLRVVPDGTVLCLQQLGGEGVKQLPPVVRVAAEIHAGLAPGVGVVPGQADKIRHSGSSFGRVLSLFYQTPPAAGRCAACRLCPQLYRLVRPGRRGVEKEGGQTV